MLQDRLRHKYTSIYAWKSCSRIGCEEKDDCLQLEMVFQYRLRDKCMSIYRWKSCCRIGCAINIWVFTHGNRGAAWVAR